MQANHTPTCAYCGAVVTLSKSQKQRVKRGGPIYCDRRCYGDSMSAPVHRNCLVCGAPFVTRQSRVDEGFGLYCGKPCSNKARAVPEADRFWALVDRTGDGCWLWLGARDKDGYGLFALRERGQTVAHRWIYQQVHGSLDASIKVLHHCDNPPCCRLDHLFAGTPADNMADMVAKGRQKGMDTHPRAQLTEDDVRAIRALHAAGGITLSRLATQYGAHIATIHSIVSRRTWKYLE